MNWDYSTNLFTPVYISQSIYTMPSQSFCSHTKYVIIALKNNDSQDRQNGSESQVFLMHIDGKCQFVRGSSV